MKIVIITPYLGEAFGTERVLADSCRLLRKEGHQVYFITDVVGAVFPDCDGLKHQAGLSHLRTLATRKQTASIVQEIETYLESIPAEVVVLVDAFHPHLVDAIRQKWPTVYTAHSVSPTCPSSVRIWGGDTLCGVKSGWSCLVHDFKHHCLPFPDASRKAYAVLDFLRKQKSLRQVHRVVAVSQSLKKILVADGWEESKIDVTYNPIEVPSDLTRIPDAPSPLLVTTSRLIPMKGLSPLLDAVKQIESHPWTLWIVGDGNQGQFLRDKARDLGLEKRIIFLGKKTYRETQQIVASATVFLQPNIGPEAFGIGMAESLALGIPVIATDLPALPEVVRHETTGLIVPAADNQAMASAILRLLNDEGLRKRLGSEGKKDVQTRFGTEPHLRNMEKSFKAAITAFSNLRISAATS